MARKLHNGDAGYVAERMNPFREGIVLAPGRDCKIVIYKAQEQGIDVGTDKYAVVCNAHGAIVGTTSIPKAREFMKYPEFCEDCMDISRRNP